MKNIVRFSVLIASYIALIEDHALLAVGIALIHLCALKKSVMISVVDILSFLFGCILIQIYRIESIYPGISIVYCLNSMMVVHLFKAHMDDSHLDTLLIVGTILCAVSLLTRQVNGIVTLFLVFLPLFYSFVCYYLKEIVKKGDTYDKFYHQSPHKTSH